MSQNGNFGLQHWNCKGRTLWFHQDQSKRPVVARTPGASHLKFRVRQHRVLAAKACRELHVPRKTNHNESLITIFYSLLGGARPTRQNHQGPFLTRGLLEDPAPYAPKPPGALFDQGPLGGPRALRSKTTRGPQGPLGGLRALRSKTTRGPFWPGASWRTRRPTLQNDAPKPPGALFDQGPLGGPRALRSKTTRGPFWPGASWRTPRPTLQNHQGALFDQGPLGRPRTLRSKTTRGPFWPGASWRTPRPTLQNHQGPFLIRGRLEDSALYAPKPPGALFDWRPLGGTPKTTRGPFWPGVSWRTPPQAPKPPEALFKQGPLGGLRPKPQNHLGPFFAWRTAPQTPKPAGTLFDQGPLGGPHPKPQNHQGPF